MQKLTLLSFLLTFSFWSYSQSSEITPTGANFINGASWTTAQLLNQSTGGQLNLFAGGGTGLNFSVGPDPSNVTRGRLYLYSAGANKVELRIFDDAGIVSTNGQNGSDNTFLSWPSGRPNVGYLAVEDDNGQIQAGCIVNSMGQGEVFGDTKNFRMEHPTQKGKEIWYASIEGPEAGAYERGTAKLERGEAFIEFSDHFQLVVNPKTMTVILTPLSADTYGLAVIEKLDKGIRVKELKGGTGNFEFDWEVKGIRKGYEDYRVIRDASEMLPATKEEISSTLEEPQESTPAIAEPTTEQQVETADAFLSQNRPNPFSEATTIKYRVPETAGKAELKVIDLNGKVIAVHQLGVKGEGTVEISGGTLPAGMYTYSLIIDGKLQASRQMVLTK